MRRSTSRSPRRPGRSTSASGRCARGGGRALVVDAAVPGVGNVIEQLADSVEVETEGEHEFLRVRLAYAGAD